MPEENQHHACIYLHQLRSESHFFSNNVRRMTVTSSNFSTLNYIFLSFFITLNLILNTHILVSFVCLEYIWIDFHFGFQFFVYKFPFFLIIVECMIKVSLLSSVCGYFKDPTTFWEYSLFFHIFELLYIEDNKYLHISSVSGHTL